MDLGLRGQGQVGVVPGVVADVEQGVGGDIVGDVPQRWVVHLASHHQESGGDVVGTQGGQDLRGDRGVGTVVEGQRYLAV